MRTTVRPRWGLCVAQIGVAVVGGLVVTPVGVAAFGVTTPGVIVGLILLGGTIAGVVWLEIVKTRRVAASALEASGVAALAGEDHAHAVRRLTDSRRAIVDAYELERARIERDLHDGAQQYLVAASMKVGEAAFAVEQGRTAEASGLLAAAQDDADAALAALRETVAGVHSRLLAEQGLEAGLAELVTRLSRRDRPIVLRVPHPLPDLPRGVASTAWFFAAEALTNAVKHAGDADISIVAAADHHLHVTVVDAGPGGAVVVPGRGLAGLRARLEAFGGTLTVSSPAGGPTTVAARVPLLLSSGQTPGEEET
ncbi:sensor histidine kinase [Propioniciclava soli]|uniref:histidine kinase n=1 Tax=Propioniciclava soli TaxID=2775081 RepID=A0ABZ3C3B0_9ACTN|nr:histidine kinase [Propioniciclava soli]